MHSVYFDARGTQSSGHCRVISFGCRQSLALFREVVTHPPQFFVALVQIGLQASIDARLSPVRSYANAFVVGSAHGTSKAVSASVTARPAGARLPCRFVPKCALTLSVSAARGVSRFLFD